MFDPTAIEIATDGQRSLLKARAAVQWEEARRRYTELSGQMEGNEEGALNQVFSKAYDAAIRSEEHTSELQSLMRISYAVFCLKKKKKNTYRHTVHTQITRIRSHTDITKL